MISLRIFWRDINLYSTFLGKAVYLFILLIFIRGFYQRKFRRQKSVLFIFYFFYGGRFLPMTHSPTNVCLFLFFIFLMRGLFWQIIDGKCVSYFFYGRPIPINHWWQRYVIFNIFFRHFLFYFLLSTNYK